MPESSTSTIDVASYRCHATIDGARLRELRVRSRYSAAQLGKEWGCSGGAILMWERGDRDIPCWVDRAVADWLTFGEIPSQKPRDRPKAAPGSKSAGFQDG